MKINLTLDGITSGLSHILHRFHIVLFVVLVLGGMAAMVFVVNQTIIRSTDTSQQRASAQSTSFDEKTIDKLEDLNSDSGGNISLPGGQRTNPFVE